VRSLGRVPVYWYEKDDGPAGAVAMTWLDEDSGAAAAAGGRDVVLTPHLRTYFDYPTAYEDGPFAPDRILPLRQAYAFDPPTSVAGAGRILGIQAQLWSEYLPTPADVERRAFPRLSAFAEVAWGTADDYEDFLLRLPGHLRRLGLSARYEQGA
jgi:hexosaminidase